MKKLKKKIYLDYAATTPLDAGVFSNMKPYFEDKFGNPSSLHSFGQEARQALDEARQKVSYVLDCRPKEIIFTSSGTEANNLAIKGISEANKFCGHVITTRIEHHSVLEPMKFLREQGVKVTYIEVDNFGRVNPASVVASIQPDTFLICIMYVNNEVGTIEPITEISQRVKRKNKNIVIHTDAVQAAGFLPLSIRQLGVDLLSLSAHKFYGPKGVGILYKRQGVDFSSQILGGGQELGWRSGTENVAGIVGAAKSLSEAETGRQKESARLSELRDFLIKSVTKSITRAVLTGHPEERLANNVSFCFPGLEGEALTLRLSERGFACSSGSACSTGKFEPSHVLLALGLAPELSLGSLRVSLGRTSTKKDLEQFVRVLKEEVEKLAGF